MIDVALAHVDGARARMAQWLGPRARPLLVDRETRVAWMGTTLVVALFVASGALPVWVLALGPIAWGVPHVLADVRYLVVRPGYHARLAIALPAFVGMLVAYVGLGLPAVLVGAGAAAACARGRLARRLLVAAPFIVLALLSARAPLPATLAYAHLHNVVAIAFFVAWRRRRGLGHLLVVAAFVLGAIAILAGAFDASLAHGPSIGNVLWDDVRADLAPDDFVARISSDPRMPDRLLLLYAFGQSVHYVAWLRLVPEEDRPSKTGRSFRQSLRALRRDLGRPLLLLAAVASLVVLVWALFDLATARIRYLQIVFFHGWIELVAAAVMLVEGRPTMARR